MWSLRSWRKALYLYGLILILVAVTVAGCQSQQSKDLEFLAERMARKPAGPPLASADTTENTVVRSMIEALRRQSTFSAKFSFQRSGMVEEWDVSYMHMNDSGGQWKASGTVTAQPSGKHVVFDSVSTSTCLRQLQPVEGTWVLHEHINWVNADNPGAITPPMPLGMLRADPPLVWKSAADRDSKKVVIAVTELSSADAMAAKGSDMKSIMFVDPETWLLNREETYLDGDMVAWGEYDRYGIADVSGVHRTKEECKGRNP